MQRNPCIRSVHAEERRALIDLVAQEDLDYFRGHFAACALLPGVVQINWAIDLGRRLLGLSGAFRELKGVKFVRVIAPGDELTLRLTCDEARRELKFEYVKDEEACSLGTVLFHSPS